MSSACRVLVWAACLWSSLVCAAAASTYPPGFTEGVVASGLTNPTAMAFAPDGRLFVSEQGGRLRVIKDGLLLPAPFVTLTVNAVGERGLLGVAFDPAFTTNHWVYVYYTATTPDIHNRVSRFTAGGDVALAGSELVLLDLNVEPVTSSANHNGGALQFGLDGKLYISVGDNGDVSNSQSLLTRSRQDPAGQRGRNASRPTTRSSTRRRACTAPSGRSGCAIRSRSRCSRGPAACSSTTWARTPGKRSTTGSPGPTTAGRRVKGPTASSPRSRVMAASTVRSTPTTVERPPSARSSAARSTTRRRSSIRRRSSTRTSSRICVPGGSAGSIPPPESCRTSAPASRARSRSGCRPTAASTI